MVAREESQYTLQLSKDCSSSLIVLDDSNSTSSERSSGINKTFDFDTLVLCSNAYRRAGRYHLRKAINNKRSQVPYHTKEVPYVKSFKEPEVSQKIVAPTARKSRFLSGLPRNNADDSPESSTAHQTGMSFQKSTKSSRPKPFIRWPKPYISTRRLQEGFRQHRSIHEGSLSELDDHTRLNVQKLYLLGLEDSGKTTLLKMFLALGNPEYLVHHARSNR